MKRSMSTTTIEVSDDTWTALHRKKGRGQSFDDVIQAILNEDANE